MVEPNAHVREFVREVQKTFRVEAPESFWDCEASFRKLLASSFVAEILNAELARAARGEDTSSDWLAAELVLHRGGGLGLSISLLEEPHRYIHSLAYHAMYAPVGSNAISCSIYDLPSGFRNDVFDPRARLTYVGTTRVTPGELFLLHSGRQAYDFSGEHAAPVLKFMTTAIQPLEWLFTRNGLQAWQANDSDLTFTQLRVAADVAGKFAHQSSLQPLKRLTNHPHHAVRWAAIQNLARLSRSEAVVRLREATGDPHPHVQRAARKTLDKLETR